MHSIIISKSTSSLGVRTSSNIITNTTRTVAPDGYRRGRWTPKDKEPSQDHSSSEIPEEPVKYCRTCPPMQPCATDVLVLLDDTVTYHLCDVRMPHHRHWPT